MKHHFFFVIPRISRDENTVAVVQGFVSKEELRDPDEFKKALRNALTFWAQNSELGREMWEESSHDFNIGDLSTLGPRIVEGQVEDALVTALATVGISSMEVQCFVSDCMPRAWTYDSILMDEGKLDQ